MPSETPKPLEVGDRIYVQLSRAHKGYARVRQLERGRIYYDVEPASSRWAAGILDPVNEGQSWCRDTPEEIAALKVAEALR